MKYLILSLLLTSCAVRIESPLIVTKVTNNRIEVNHSKTLHIYTDVNYKVGDTIK